MEDKVKSLSRKRVEKTGDCRNWTPLDCLEETLRMVKAGEIKPTQIAIHWFEGERETGMNHYYNVAGVTYPEHIALMHIGLEHVKTDWLED